MAYDFAYIPQYVNKELLRPIAALPTSRTPTFRFNFSTNDDLFDLAVKVETGYRKTFGQAGEIAKVNAEALAFVKRAAKANLAAKVQANRSPLQFNTQRLERAIGGSAYSRAEATGFQFLIHTKKLLDAVPYYLAVEEGSYASVGRRVPLLFLTTKSTGDTLNRSTTSSKHVGKGFSGATKARRPDVSRSTHPTLGVPLQLDKSNRSVLKSDRIVGPSEFARKNLRGRTFRQGKFLVTITRPVPAYHYARDAADQFLEKGIYVNLLNQRKKQLEKATQMKLDIFSGPKKS